MRGSLSQFGVGGAARRIVARGIYALFFLLCTDNNADAQQATTAEQFVYYGSQAAIVRSPDSNAAIPATVGNDNANKLGVLRGLNQTAGQELTFVPNNVISSEFEPLLAIDPFSGNVAVLTDFPVFTPSSIAFNGVAVTQRRSFRSFDVGAVFWLYESEPSQLDSAGNTAHQAMTETAEVARSMTDRKSTSASRQGNSPQSPKPIPPLFTRYAAGRRNDGFGILYGYREFSGRDLFGFDINGGIIGKAATTTKTDNWAVGPQIGLAGYKRLGRFSLYAHSIYAVALNDGEISQDNSIGYEPIPGATNRLLYGQATESSYSQFDENVMSIGILWAEAGLDLTDKASLKVAWSIMLIDDVFLTDSRTRFFLPSMGLRDPGNQSLSSQNFFCGVEWVR